MAATAKKLVKKGFAWPALAVSLTFHLLLPAMNCVFRMILWLMDNAKPFASSYTGKQRSQPSP